MLREKADSFVLELRASSCSSVRAPCAPAAAPAPALAPAAAGSSPLVRLRSTERFIVLDLTPCAASGASTPPACPGMAEDASSFLAGAAGAAAFGSPIREVQLEAEAAYNDSPEAPPAADAGAAAPCAPEEADPCHTASSSRLLGPWTLAALAGVSGAALCALRWKGH